jgi:TrmH family RNA methyltransferase
VLRVVLVRPIYAGNVGAALRVAANLGVAEMVLVAPTASTDDPDFRRMAMGGGRHVRMSEADTLDEAVAGVDVVVATTSTRTRDPRGVLTPAEVCERLRVAGAQRVAVVFGPEQSGLSKMELRRCHILLSVPTNPDFPVLNLSQAVGIVVTALGPAGHTLPVSPDPMDGPALPAELHGALDHMEAVLVASGFLDHINPARVMDQIRRWVGRSVPTRREIAILRGIAAHIDYIWRRLSDGG